NDFDNGSPNYNSAEKIMDSELAGRSAAKTQVIDVLFMKIIDPKVGDNGNRNQIRKDKSINETFKGKAIPIKTKPYL
ncbi:24530_t:CDS:2, partial [Gigaspora rosea]